MRLRLALAALTVAPTVAPILALTACKTAPLATPTEAPPTEAPPAEAPPAAPPIQTAEVVGHWTGDWGDLYLREEADGTVRGVYPHDSGAVVGRIENGVFRGWWCEWPSRQPDADAGDVEFQFGRDAQGLYLDGRWRYGASSADWRDDWDLRWTDAPIDPQLMAGFDDASRFCPHP